MEKLEWRKQGVEVFETKEKGGRFARITFKGGVFADCEFKAKKHPYTYDDWLFVLMVAKKIVEIQEEKEKTESGD